MKRKVASIKTGFFLLTILVILSACHLAGNETDPGDSLSSEAAQNSPVAGLSEPVPSEQETVPVSDILQVLSDEEYLLISGMRDVTRHRIKDHRQLDGYECPPHPAFGHNLGLYFTGQNAMLWTSGAECIVISPQMEPVLKVTLPTERVILPHAFSTDLSRFVITSEDKQSLFVFGVDGDLIWSSERDLRFADETCCFGISEFFENPDYLLCQMLGERWSCHMIVNMADFREEPVFISGSQAVKPTPNGFILCDGYFGTPNEKRKNKTDFFQVVLTGEGPQVEWIETPEQFAGSDVLLVGEFSDTLIYSRYLPDDKERVFYRTNPAMEYLGETRIPDEDGHLLELDGICHAENSYAITPDGKHLLVNDFNSLLSIELN